MADKRTSERQHLKESCDFCAKDIREDAIQESEQRIYGQLDKLFDSKFGNFQSNSKRLEKHSFILTIHTISDIAQTIAILYLIFNKK